MTPKSVPASAEVETLGSRLRAARLCFYWIDDLERYVRLSPMAPDRWRVQLRKPSELPSKSDPRHETHIVEWDKDSVLVTVLFLRGRRMIAEGQDEAVLTEDGKLLL